MRVSQFIEALSKYPDDIFLGIGQWVHATWIPIKGIIQISNNQLIIDYCSGKNLTKADVIFELQKYSPDCIVGLEKGFYGDDCGFEPVISFENTEYGLELCGW